MCFKNQIVLLIQVSGKTGFTVINIFVSLRFKSESPNTRDL